MQRDHLSNPALLAFTQDDSAPINRMLKGEAEPQTLPTGNEVGEQVASARRHPGLDPGSSAIKSLIARDSSHGADAPLLDSGSRPE